ncbi:uncharacterized protein LOC122148710 [Cyprinus carpio]|uniref:Uncharacterized protein LOC122148710 n=1 Tax=Cyprinus carpio TaxID=7962 RepID=A0A9Q9Z4D8_CYPCA|nr:uncharacterized protein LOC122148710 [Cyprinus carpio]
MIYRYQEWADGVHNYDDHIILSLHFCLYIRASLQTHTTAGRVFEAMELSLGVKLPPHSRILQGYMHFEALTDHQYIYSCVKCGSNPAIVVMDLHKKGVFSLPVSEIPDPSDYTGIVDMEEFWTSLSSEIISDGLMETFNQETKPFVVQPDYNKWSPWIGPQTRKSNLVYNTEWEKVHKKLTSSEKVNVEIPEDRLLEQVMAMKVEEVKKLCKSCGMDSSGSKMDLILQLRTEIKNRSSYDKVFAKVWGASGGWATIMCPCGIVYSLKFNLRAESPRDYMDMLMSWQHIPNIVIYDFARGLATHGTIRFPTALPFSPHEGRLLSPTAENIQCAKEGRLTVKLPWLIKAKETPDINGHPLTGSSEHYVLYDKLHEGNTKDDKDVLRRIELVPELAGRINSQVVEQFFSQMEKDNYFLNMMKPSTQIFLIRNIIHHRNSIVNTARMDKIKKSLDVEHVTLNKHGQAVIGKM